MKGSVCLKFCFPVVALCVAGQASTETLTPAQFRQLTQDAQRNVIVILRDQMSALPPERRAMSARSTSLTVSQNSVLSQLPLRGTRKVRHFSLINAFATTVSSAEAAQLASHPMVQAVVDDVIIHAPARKSQLSEAIVNHAAAANPAAAADTALCNTLEPEALQLTHAAFADPSVPQAQQVRDENGQPVTGQGVKIAFIADGLDTTLQGFIRPNGSSVFVDYQDFSGDPVGTATGGGEAFGDASSIAAQDMPNGKPLNFNISQFVNPAHPLVPHCDIRIRGMAPGASLVGLKVYSNLHATTASNFVQAIEYAVVHDDVDVINESFGGGAFPDNANDAVALANDAAVRAGVTVVVATGDAGTAGTLQTPATQPSVIAAGATTQFRLYAQTGEGAIPLESASGFVDNNISALSSAGFSQLSARTVDVVAPGDLGWALCSTKQTLFFDCGNNTAAFGPSAVQAFGGASESTALISGEAALVIQAYRSTHRGVDPTPATVKQIIMNTATDLGAPTAEQGAGLINSLAAVNAALSIEDQHGRPKPHGAGVLSSPVSISITGEPHGSEIRSFTLTNVGTVVQNLSPVLQTLGAPSAGATLGLRVDTTHGPTFANSTGGTRAYVKQSFKVPAGADHLDAAIAFQTAIDGATDPFVAFALVDPSGRHVAYSIPQGSGSGYGHVDVVHPVGGTWTVFAWTRVSGQVGSYGGPIQFTWAAEHYVKLGTVFPAHLTLAPGANASITAEFSMPASPGDLAAAIRFEQAPNALNASDFAIPISLRTLVPVGSTGGNFTGTLTGGNGRAGDGPTQTFAFDVPPGVNNMSLVLEIADNGYLMEGLLVDPQGMQLSVEPNQDPVDGSPQFALQLFHNNPQPGRWKFVLLQNFISSGNQTSLPFTARIGFNTARVKAIGLPNSANVTLSANGTPLSVPIQVTNTGAVTEQYFADARLNTTDILQLPAQQCGGITVLPGACGSFFLPTQVTTVAFIAQSSVPITMDAYNNVGTGVGATRSPDIYAEAITPNIVAAFLSEPEVPYSAWLNVPSLIGPYGPQGTPTEPVATSAFVVMHAFDSAMTSDAGDIWQDLVLNTSTFNPLVLTPGQVGTINVLITPDPGAVGLIVSGYIYIDTFNANVTTGDEVVRIPYSYKVGP